MQINENDPLVQLDMDVIHISLHFYYKTQLYNEKNKPVQIL